ncbi:tetratricopeptide repeat protein [Luteolibacter soli]|uniref:Tetratricopeptide repeat protein n=1 Tax=Luteolibacter soli TaxID=3135280 RepID=A0ABU9AXH2_9BACT
MKPIAMLLCCLLPVAAVSGQEKEKPKTEIRAFEQEFSNLPKEQREEFMKKLGEGQRLFGQKRVFEAINKANEAAAIFKAHPDLQVLLGACQVEFRNFDKAMEHFKEADKLAPGISSILFNMAELNFVTKDWKAAETNLEKVLLVSKKSTLSGDLQLSRLVEFKLLLCKLKLGKKDEAAKLAKKYDYLDDSPFPYYAEAAMAFSEGRDVEAEGAMARGGRIFANPEMIAPWQDTMVEFGYIKGFFGGDLEKGAEGE